MGALGGASSPLTLDGKWSLSEKVILTSFCINLRGNRHFQGMVHLSCSGMWWLDLQCWERSPDDQFRWWWQLFWVVKNIFRDENLPVHCYSTDFRNYVLLSTKVKLLEITISQIRKKKIRTWGKCWRDMSYLWIIKSDCISLKGYGSKW